MEFLLSIVTKTKLFYYQFLSDTSQHAFFYVSTSRLNLETKVIKSLPASGVCVCSSNEKGQMERGILPNGEIAISRNIILTSKSLVLYILAF